MPLPQDSASPLSDGRHMFVSARAALSTGGTKRLDISNKRNRDRQTVVLLDIRGNLAVRNGAARLRCDAANLSANPTRAFDMQFPSSGN